MPVPAPPTITMPPTPPSRSDPANFAARGDAFLGWFPTAWTYLSNLVTWLSLRANEVEANSNAAVQAASTVSSVAASSPVQNAASNAAAAQLAATQAQAYASQAQAVSPDSPVRLNTRRISAALTIPAGYNASSAGRISIDDGITVTISDHSTWSIT